MSDDVAAPVKGISKAFDTGVKLAKRISKSASSAPTETALRISEATQTLQTSLERSSALLADAYSQSVAQCGQPFVEALVQDHDIQGQLKDLRIELIDQINECQDLDEEPEYLNAAFNTLQKQADRCCTECIAIFSRLRDQLLQATYASKAEFVKDDRTQLSSMRKQTPQGKDTEMVPAPLRVEKPKLSVDSLLVEPVKPRNPWSIDGHPSEFIVGPQLESPIPMSPRPQPRDISPGAQVDGPSFIAEAVVYSRLNQNEEFLERRRQSRLLFQSEFRGSISSIEEDRASESFDIGSIQVSPNLGYSTTGSVAEGRSSRTSASGYESLMARQRSQGHSSHQTGSSRTSSFVHDQPRGDSPTYSPSIYSQDSLFGIRMESMDTTATSPPLSDHRSPNSEILGKLGLSSQNSLGTDPQNTNSGSYFDSGLEVVKSPHADDGPMLANEDQIDSQPTSADSVQPSNYPIRPDSSFYKFGGFCEGSKAILRGEGGVKIVKTPLGQFSVVISARCIKCMYEVSWKDVEKDRLLDPAGIYVNSGIRWRQTFASKSHLHTSSTDEPVYACLFCIEERKTIEEHDATVFFSLTQLFRHLGKHSQPLPVISGVTTLYGTQPPDTVDFDVHFINSEPKLPAFHMGAIRSKVAARPTGYSLVNVPKNSRTRVDCPDGSPVLQFAAGANIVGITFPTHFNGQWCTGYHNGERGSFPAASVALNMPDNLAMHAQSNLVATAKWDFKPKDAKDGSGWLRFKKGDRIYSIGYTFQDQWCWSGQTSKGKWGLFPAAFVENLEDAGTFGAKPGSLKEKSGFVSKLSLNRHKSSKYDLPPVRKMTSPATNGGHSSLPPLQKSQPGLEVVQRVSSLRSTP